MWTQRQPIAGLQNTDTPTRKVVVWFYFRDFHIMKLLLEIMAETAHSRAIWQTRVLTFITAAITLQLHCSSQISHTTYRCVHTLPVSLLPFTFCETFENLYLFSKMTTQSYVSLKNLSATQQWHHRKEMLILKSLERKTVIVLPLFVCIPTA